MTWLARTGVGVAVLAALALGRTIDDAVPQEKEDVRSFVHEAGIEDEVRLRFADVQVDAVHVAKTLEKFGDQVSSPGRWLVVDVTVVPQGRPLSGPGITLEDGRGRTFQVDTSRSTYSWGTAPTGASWEAQIPFEVPRDALAGATLVFAGNDTDVRRDDVARIDLGISAEEVADLWDTTEVIEIAPSGLGSP